MEEYTKRINEKWASHDDIRNMNPTSIPTIVVCSKFDIFANKFESIKKK